jgi:hypothetical protein
MRALNQNVRTYTGTLGAGLQPQATQQVPDFGPLLGISVDLTVSLTGATASVTSQTIDNVISHFALDDKAGKSIADLMGTDITILNDMLQPRGVRTAPPAITTNASGAGSAEWKLFLPISVELKDMPALLRVTFNAVSALQNAGLVSAGTAQVTLLVRGWYDSVGDGPTLRIKASSPPHQAGDNTLSPYLPDGFQSEALAFTLAGGDGVLGYVTLMHRGASFASLQPPNDFIDADTMLMQSAHLSGEFIGRWPVWVVDSTTVFTVNLASDSVIRLYSIATVPQKRE